MAPSEAEITLKYLDRLSTNLIEVGKSINKITLLLLLISSLLILAAAGLLSAASEINVLGLPIRTPTGLVILLLSLLVSLTHVQLLTLAAREHLLETTITTLYRELGLPDKLLDIDLLEHPTFITLLPENNIWYILIITFTFFFPPASIGIATYQAHLSGALLPIVATIRHLAFDVPTPYI